MNDSKYSNDFCKITFKLMNSRWVSMIVYDLFNTNCKFNLPYFWYISVL